MKSRAVIFDMDGLLLDSEPMWEIAEIAVFATVGLRLSPADCVRTRGIRIDEIARYYYSRRPWEGPPPHALAEQITDEVVRIVRERAEPLPGVREAIAACKAAGMRVGLASSSPIRLIDEVLAGFGLTDDFRATCSGEHETFGKPHPGVYLTCAEALGVEPEACLAIEDSITGLIAAKAAKMKALVVPEAGQHEDPRFSLADLKLSSLTDLDAARLEALIRA